MKLKGTLYAINSERDRYGNTYWALRYICHETGKIAEGQVSGGESNIYGILRHWTAGDDWDRSIIFNRLELPKREFQRQTRGMAYAGCRPDELANYIRARLASPECPVYGQ